MLALAASFFSHAGDGLPPAAADAAASLARGAATGAARAAARTPAAVINRCEER